MKHSVEKIIAQINAKHPNDPTISDDYLEIITLLSASDDQTINVLNELDIDQIDCISSIFEEVSANLQSARFIDCIKEIAKKYPSILNIKEHVNWAIEAMD
ncbi:MAG TPA: hypothetical protein VK151_09315 [Fluviicola sp.]|nr:hypothetical protein [Fluviicola sp.]